MIALLAMSLAWAQDPHVHGMQMEAVEEPPDGFVLFDELRTMLIPGRPMAPGSSHVMAHGMAHLQNLGVPDYVVVNAGEATSGGETLPFLQHVWLMGYTRDRTGIFEAVGMLNFEPLLLGDDGVPEIGQEGEGLLDAQHPHAFLHQAMVAIHPIPGARAPTDRFGMSLFFGQGSATIGPPIFMHRASAPGPTVPRKHHKGENPHETFPVIGATFRAESTWLDASVFNAEEYDVGDSRLAPLVGEPDSVAVRIRQGFVDDRIELQASGERLVDLGEEPDQHQVSLSAAGYLRPGGYRVDFLVDHAWVLPFEEDDHHPNVFGTLVEGALRTPSRRDVVWTRAEVGEREADAEILDAPPPAWWFLTLGAERFFIANRRLGTMVGAFAEGTLIGIPEALEPLYGREQAVTLNVGIRVQGLWVISGEHAGHGGHGRRVR